MIINENVKNNNIHAHLKYLKFYFCISSNIQMFLYNYLSNLYTKNFIVWLCCNYYNLKPDLLEKFKILLIINFILIIFFKKLIKKTY